MDFIPLKPVIQTALTCPLCQAPLAPQSVLWQGIHVCAETRCTGCQTELITDLPAGHARQTPYQVELRGKRLFGSAALPHRWFGRPLLTSLQTPQSADVPLRIERLHSAEQVIILNCLDFLYGHALLKLLNAEQHLCRHAEFGLIVLIQPCLRWLAPDGVAEIWTAELPLAQAQNYYPRLHERIAQECTRFAAINLSAAHSHPPEFDITRFTRTPLHDFTAEQFRITFIWRADRLWWEHALTLRAARRFKLLRPLAHWQNLRVRRLFARLRPRFPQAVFTVAGLGRATTFPAWIDDQRVDRFDEAAERAACRVYSASRLVLGVHGSHMLLPSAHAGITLDLLPTERWPNFAQDVLYQPVQATPAEDVRLTAWRHQYLPLEISTRALAQAAVALVENYDAAQRSFRHLP